MVYACACLCMFKHVLELALYKFIALLFVLHDFH